MSARSLLSAAAALLGLAGLLPACISAECTRYTRRGDRLVVQRLPCGLNKLARAPHLKPWPVWREPSAEQDQEATSDAGADGETPPPPAAEPPTAATPLDLDLPPPVHLRHALARRVTRPEAEEESDLAAAAGTLRPSLARAATPAPMPPPRAAPPPMSATLDLLGSLDPGAAASGASATGHAKARWQSTLELPAFMADLSVLEAREEGLGSERRYLTDERRALARVLDARCGIGTRSLAEALEAYFAAAPGNRRLTATSPLHEWRARDRRIMERRSAITVEQDRYVRLIAALEAWRRHKNPETERDLARAIANFRGVSGL